jgi:multidrug transporter EmrE-like cation transporter
MLYVGAMWEGMVTVIGSLVAYFILGERFAHWSQYLGLVLAVVAMILVQRGGRDFKS